MLPLTLIRSLPNSHVFALAPVILLALASWTWYIQNKGYQRGQTEAETQCEAEQAQRNEAVALRLAELQANHQAQLNEVLSRNVLLSDQLEANLTEIREAVNSYVQDTPISVSGNCSVGYDAVSLFNNLADPD